MQLGSPEWVLIIPEIATMQATWGLSVLGFRTKFQ